MPQDVLPPKGHGLGLLGTPAHCSAAVRAAAAACAADAAAAAAAVHPASAAGAAAGAVHAAAGVGLSAALQLAVLGSLAAACLTEQDAAADWVVEGQQALLDTQAVAVALPVAVHAGKCPAGPGS